MRFQTKYSLARLATLFKVTVVILMVVMMSNFTGSPVKGQGPPGGSMAQYYGSTNNRNIFDNEFGDVYGNGSTQPYANPYNHQGRVNVTLTSLATGRSASFDTGFVGGGASTQVMLPFDENDRGPFQTCTNHSNFCPVSGTTFGFASGCSVPFPQRLIPLTWGDAVVTSTIRGSLGRFGTVSLNLTSDQCTGGQFVLTVSFRLIDLVDCCTDDQTFVRFASDPQFRIIEYAFYRKTDPKDRYVDIFLKRETPPATGKSVLMRVSGFYPGGSVDSRPATITLNCP